MRPEPSLTAPNRTISVGVVPHDVEVTLIERGVAVRRLAVRAPVAGVACAAVALAGAGCGMEHATPVARASLAPLHPVAPPAAQPKAVPADACADNPILGQARPKHQRWQRQPLPAGFEPV